MLSLTFYLESFGYVSVSFFCYHKLHLLQLGFCLFSGVHLTRREFNDGEEKLGCFLPLVLLFFCRYFQGSETLQNCISFKLPMRYYTLLDK